MKRYLKGFVERYGFSLSIPIVLALAGYVLDVATQHPRDEMWHGGLVGLGLGMIAALFGVVVNRINAYM